MYSIDQERTLAYLAGFFDGEGCVGLYPHYPVTNDRLYLKVTIAQIDQEPIELFQSVFGGKIDIQKSRPGYRSLYRLQYNGEMAKDVLTNLYPYLVVKRQQAASALEHTNG